MIQRKLRSHLLRSAGGLALALLTGCGGPSKLSLGEIEALNVSCHYSAFIVKNLWSKFDPIRRMDNNNYMPGNPDGSLHRLSAYQGDQSEQVISGETSYYDNSTKTRKTKNYTIVEKLKTKNELADLVVAEIKRDMNTFRRECRFINFNNKEACLITTVQDENSFDAKSIYHKFIFYNFQENYRADDLVLAEFSEIIAGYGKYEVPNTNGMEKLRTCQRQQFLMAAPIYDRHIDFLTKRVEQYIRDMERKSK